MKEKIKRLAANLRAAVALFLKKDLIVYSGNGALYMTLAIFPFTILVLALTTRIPGYSADNIYDTLVDFLPKLTNIQVMFKTILRRLQTQSNGVLISISALSTVWSASSGVSALQSGMNRLNGFSGKPYFRRKGIALLVTVIMVILVPACILVNLFGHTVTLLIDSSFYSDTLLPLSDLLIKLVSLFFSLCTIFPAILGIYSMLPDKRVSPANIKSVFSGALLATFLCLIGTSLFTRIIDRFFHMSKLYGSLASIFVLIIWFHVMITVVFYCACLNIVRNQRIQETDSGK